ncbi:MAG: response regulator [Bacteroidota bacterium]
MNRYPGREILLVDDTASDVNLVKIILEELDFAGRLEVVSDGEEALAFLHRKGAYQNRRRNQLPDLILLDLHMPQMDGFEVLKQLKETARMVRLPVIILSAFDNDEEASKAYSMGAGGYIVKPTNFLQLKEKLEGILAFWFQESIH